jgi:hypothetical protein
VLVSQQSLLVLEKGQKMGSIFIEIYLKETHLKIMNFA